MQWALKGNASVDGSCSPHLPAHSLPSPTMSFWLFGAGRNGAPTIDSLLANPTSSPSTTLDALLLMPDLLSEIHAGTNQRLIDFLGREEVVLRLGGWVLWGLGGTQEEEMERGTTDDEGEDESVTVVKQRLGLGGVVRRRDMDEMGTLEGENPDETEQEKSWAGYVFSSCVSS